MRCGCRTLLDSFGKLTSSSGSLVNSIEYAGRDFDSETGLYYYRARYYDPSVGRFTTEDLSCPISSRTGSYDVGPCVSFGIHGGLVGVAVGVLLLPGPGGGDHFVQGRVRGAPAEDASELFIAGDQS